VDAVAGLEQRIEQGTHVWHWLHDNPEYGDFTLLFISLHREGDSVIAGLWEVWDEGTGVEDPVSFRSSDPDGERGAPNDRLIFRDVPAALEELAVYGVTAAGFHDHAGLVAKYAEAVRARPPHTGSPIGGAVVYLDGDDDL
jgi:hypothetical protein